MCKYYETPSIEIVSYESEIQLAASIVVEFPWAKDDETDFFE